MNTSLTFGRRAVGTAPAPAAQVSVDIEESAAQSPDYAFRSLNAPGNGFGVPEGFTLQVLRWGNRLYESHGLAEFVVDTVATLILGGGLRYTLAFEKGFPAHYEKAIRDRVKEWWYHEDVSFEDRAHVLVVDALIEGEHGWKFDVNRVNGFVHIGSISREQVKTLSVDAFDTFTLRAVQISETDGKTIELDVLRKDPATRLLRGSCLYFRNKFRATNLRGRPVLQAVIDELRSEKQFRLLGTDRALTRLSVFMDTKIEGTDAEVAAFAKANGSTLPTNGRRLYHNESVVNDFLSANMEAGDLTEMMRFLISIVAASAGFPPSWMGVGEGANRSIAETQQDPAMRNRKRERDMFLRFFERTVDFVIDSAIDAGIIASDLVADKKIEVLDESGKKVMRPLRECVTVNVTATPIENTDRDAEPLSATNAALVLLESADDIAGRLGIQIYSAAERASILNWAHKRDGLDVEISPEFKTTKRRDPDIDVRPAPAEPSTPDGTEDDVDEGVDEDEDEDEDEDVTEGKTIVIDVSELPQGGPSGE